MAALDSEAQFLPIPDPCQLDAIYKASCPTSAVLEHRTASRNGRKRRCRLQSVYRPRHYTRRGEWLLRGRAWADTRLRVPVARQELSYSPEDRLGPYLTRRGGLGCERYVRDTAPYLPHRSDATVPVGHDGPYVYPWFFGKQGVQWESIFKYVKNPLVLWEVWKPKDIGAYSSLLEVWNDWDQPRVVQGRGTKPPLKLVEGKWEHGWGRTSTNVSGLWNDARLNLT